MTTIGMTKAHSTGSRMARQGNPSCPAYSAATSTDAGEQWSPRALHILGVVTARAVPLPLHAAIVLAAVLV
jgi:hypothetical protein